jgi:hypothetical protein
MQESEVANVIYIDVCSGVIGNSSSQQVITVAVEGWRQL